MDNRRKSLYNLIYNAISQVITIALGMLLPRLFVVSYGSEVNGLLNSLNQFLAYLSLFEAGIGTTTLQALYAPVARNDWNQINGILVASDTYFKKTGFWYFIGLVVLSFCYPLIVDSTLSYFSILAAVLLSGLSNVVLYAFQYKYQCLLQADGKQYVLAKMTSLSFICTSITKVILICFHVHFVLILAITFLIQCGQAVYIFLYLKKYPKLDLTVAPDYEPIAQKNYVLLYQICALIFRNTDVFILTVACGLKVVSVYSLFKLVTSQIEKLLTIFMNSIGFVLGQNYQTNLPLYIYRIDLVESYYSAIVYGLFSVAYFLFLPFMKLYTAGVTDANYCDPKLPILFVLVSLLDRSRTPMFATITYAGHFRQTLFQTFLEAAINLSVSLIGVYFWGIYGVLIGTIVALAYRTNDIIIYANKKLLNRMPWRTYSIYLLNIVFFILTQLIFRRLFSEPTSYINFVWVGFLATLLSLGIYIGGQSIIMPHCRNFLRHLIREKRIG